MTTSDYKIPRNENIILCRSFSTWVRTGSLFSLPKKTLRRGVCNHFVSCTFRLRYRSSPKLENKRTRRGCCWELCLRNGPRISQPLICYLMSVVLQATYFQYTQRTFLLCSLIYEVLIYFLLGLIRITFNFLVVNLRICRNKSFYKFYKPKTILL